MNTVIEWFTRRRVFVVGLTGSVIVYLLQSTHIFSWLYINKQHFVSGVLEWLQLFSMLCIPLLIVSTIYGFIKNEQVFRSWKKLTFIYFCIYIFLLIIAPWGGQEYFLKFIEKGLLSLSLNIIYLVFSLIYIPILLAYKQPRTKKSR